MSGGIIPEFVLPLVEVPVRGTGSETELDIAGVVDDSVDDPGVVMINKTSYKQPSLRL